VLSENRPSHNSTQDCSHDEKAALHLEHSKTRQTLIDDAMQNPQFLEELAIPDHPRVSQLVPFIPSEITCSVLPPPAYVPSNPRAPTAPDRILYVNGMRVDSAGIRRDLCQIAVCFGRKTTAVINPPERPLFKYDSEGFTLSFRNAVGGLFSTTIGMALERDTIAALIEEIKSGVLVRGERVLILAHSQGSIITGNAFQILLSESGGLSEKQKDALRANVTVTVVGAAQRRFPSGIESEELAHSGDVVPRITAPLSYAQHGIGVGVQTVKDWLAGYKEQWEVAKRVHDALPNIQSTEWAEKVVLSGGHSLQSYLDNLHLFFIERAKDSKGNIDSVLLADRYVRSVWQGEYSDIVYCRIIKNRLESGDIEFAKQIIRLCSNAGTIGNFKVPSLENLKDLSCTTPPQDTSESREKSRGRIWYDSVKDWFSTFVSRREN
jgi:hypothetical protein